MILHAGFDFQQCSNFVPKDVGILIRQIEFVSLGCICGAGGGGGSQGETNKNDLSSMFVSILVICTTADNCIFLLGGVSLDD